MRQAIEGEFILDVLKHYTTYGTYFGLLKACEDGPNVERMDQNEDIFVRFMNDASFQKIVTAWMASETYRRLRSDDARGESEHARSGALPPRLRIVEPQPSERYSTCVPLVPLKAAAGAFSDPQQIDDDGYAWAAVETGRRLRPGMFVAQVVGKSMEPAISDGAYCLFAAPDTPAGNADRRACSPTLSPRAG